MLSTLTCVLIYSLTKCVLEDVFNPIQDGPFWGCSQMGGQKGPLPKISHTYPTKMKLGTVILYLEKTQKIYESHDAPLEFC